ncbi:hypothetical protein L596_000029 [Steinernema carpocapsae]|uniref:DUF7083 domain-containing protein n=1 Tax=Steinernema carpocapsae TaxID=34508 RepID=A0A4U8UHD8_STECR|nr:hypothetical protein L596_000029 [Steinernema carpocapsae]
MEALLALLVKQQADAQTQIKQLAEALQQQTFGPSAASAAANVDSLAAQLDTFDYDEDAGVTFTAWHDRHRRVFDKDAAALKDPEKVSLLLRKLSSATYHRYAKLLRPRKPEDQTFEETVAELNKVFAPPTSRPTHGRLLRGCQQLRRRCRGRQLHARPSQVLCAIAGLLQREDESTRRLLLQKMEKEPEAKLVDLLEEYRRWSKLQDDNDLVSKKKDFQCINAVNTPNPRRTYTQNNPRSGSKREKKTMCWNCDGPHHSSRCPAPLTICPKCRKKGHRERVCETANKYQTRLNYVSIRRPPLAPSTAVKTTI